MTSTILDFISRMGYSNVGILQMDSFQLPYTFSSNANQMGINVGVEVTITTGQSTFVNEISAVRDSGVRLVVCSLLDSSTDNPEQQLAFREAISQGIMGPDSGYIWITYNLPNFSDNGLWPNMTLYVNGTLSPAAPESYFLPDSRQDMIQRWNNITTQYAPQNDYWYNHSKPNNEATLFSYNYGMCNAVNAVLTVAYSLQKLIYIDQVEYTGQTLIDTMKLVDFVGPCGRVTFNSVGDMIYTLGMANYIYTNNITARPNKYLFDDKFGSPAIPMSVDLSNVLLNGQREVGEWESDFTCSGGCAYGTCVGTNDCQCHRGYTKTNDSQSSDSEAASCSQQIAVIDDSIVIQLIPSSQFLVTRTYERVIAQAVAQSLMVNLSQIETVDFGLTPDGGISFEFVLYADANQSKVLLETDLTFAMMNMETNLDPLLATSLLQTRIATKDWVRFNEPLGGFLFAILIIMTVILIVTLLMAVKLFQLPYQSTEESRNRSRNLGFSWYTNGTVFVGIILSIITGFIQMNQPNDWTCRLQPWTLFTSLSLIINVKVAKLYRLHRIFNNPEFKQIKLPDNRLLIQYILPSTLITLIILIASNIVGLPVAVLETSSNLGRLRGYACLYESSNSFYAVTGLLLAIHIVTSVGSLFLRFQLLHLRTFHLDSIYSDALLIIVSPFIMGALWYNIVHSSASPRILSIIVIIWMLLTVLASLVIQHTYKFIRVLILGEQVANSRFTSSVKSDYTSSISESVLALTKTTDIKLAATIAPEFGPSTFDWTDTNILQMRIEVARIGRVFRDAWRKCNVKYITFSGFQGTLVRFIGLLYSSSDNDWTGILLSDNIQAVFEINPSNFILRVLTLQGEGFLLRAKNIRDYSKLLAALKEVINVEVTSKIDAVHEGNNTTATH